MYSPLFRKLFKQDKNEAIPSAQKKERAHKRSHSFPHNGVWFLCRYGGKIMPRYDRKLVCVGGVRKNIMLKYYSTFSDLTKLISEKFGDDLVFHYYHSDPDNPIIEDDLIPVTDDNSVRKMFADFKSRRNPKSKVPLRLSAILFPSHAASLDAQIVGSINDDPDVLQQRYNDALSEGCTKFITLLPEVDNSS